MRLTRFCLVFLALLATTAQAHEFWLEPRAFQVDSDETLEADLRNGENFKGISLSFFENRFTRFEMVMGDRVTPITGRMGDSPALRAEGVGQDGLLVILHETTPSLLKYAKWEKFQKFAAHKDFATAEADHLAAGWPQEGFRERYTRHAKALVAVGNGTGQDQAFGLQTEFVAQTNPYAADFEGTMVVALFEEGQPRGDAQVEVFERAPDGTVDVTLHRTDADGVARVKVTAGHDYLFDAVVLRPAPADPDDPRAPVWLTHWAALTFHVPGPQ
ncbi:MAG: DUF4198 domain-containing protein [Roseobacter sp.]